MSKPSIRPYSSISDWQHCRRVFETTIDSSLDYSAARNIGYHIWCEPYLVLSPETCFVLDTGSREDGVVGYIIGHPCTASFAKKWKDEYVPRLDVRDFDAMCTEVEGLDAKQVDTLGWLKDSAFDANCSMLLEKPELLDKYPAHLHIDILPGWQGKGWGQKLMEVFLGKMFEQGAKGVHLGMAKGNEGARRFYERLGFRLCEEVLDGGICGEVGTAGDAICLVKEL